MATVLIVEDDQSNSLLFETAFVKFGYDVITSDHARDIAQLVMRVMPALILMNIHVHGGVNGLDAARQIKAVPQLAHIPIVAVSARNPPGIEHAALDAGCAYFIVKPLALRQLQHIAQHAGDSNNDY